MLKRSLPEQWTQRLDGVDPMSPRAEIEAELARVKAARAAPDLEEYRQMEMRRLESCLSVATGRGGMATR